MSGMRQVSAKVEKTVQSVPGFHRLENCNRLDSLFDTLVMLMRQGQKFRRLLLGRSIAQKISPADFRPGQILQQVRFAQGRMKFNMEVKATVVASAGGRLM